MSFFRNVRGVLPQADLYVLLQKTQKEVDGSMFGLPSGKKELK